MDLLWMEIDASEFTLCFEITELSLCFEIIEFPLSFEIIEFPLSFVSTEMMLGKVGGLESTDIPRDGTLLGTFLSLWFFSL